MLPDAVQLTGSTRAGQRSQSTIEVERMLRADILLALGRHRAEAISKLHVMQVVESVAARRSFVAADQVLGLIKAIHNWANGTGRLEVKPTLGRKKRNLCKTRERVLCDLEVRTLRQALDAAPKLSAEIRVALKLELLLGVRIGEARGALRSEIDFRQRIWTIPAHRTKANREHKLPAV
jgi:integrase